MTQWHASHSLLDITPSSDYGGLLAYMPAETVIVTSYDSFVVLVVGGYNIATES